MVAQEVYQVNIGNKMSHKTLEKFMNGAIYTGAWMVFDYPQD